MSVVVEMVRFRVTDAEALRAARPGMLADFAADRDGFLGSNLIQLAGDEWLDLVWWRSADDLAASRAKGPNLPGIAEFFAAIDEILTDERGETTEPPVSR